MVSTRQLPDKLKPFGFHGVRFQKSGSDGNVVADCPFCDKPMHFFASSSTGLWDCKRCGEEGNVVVFLSKVAENRCRETSRSMWRALARDRGIPAGLMIARGMGWDPVRGSWLIPFAGESGAVANIGKWSGKNVINTAGLKSCLWGLDRLVVAPKETTIWLLEGPWDGLALDWLARDAGSTDVAVAVPGCNIFKKDWVEYFDGRRVVCCYDNDEPGDKGAMRVEQLLADVAENLEFVHWPESRPSGYDLRDFVRETMPESSAKEVFDQLKSMRHPFPRRGQSEPERDAPVTSAQERTDLPELEEMPLEQVMETFDEHIHLTADMIDVMRLMLAVCLSNDLPGDPLWLYIVGPASAGKTLLLSSLRGSKRCVFRSKITQESLVSGFKDKNRPRHDPSLIPRLSGKTLVTKDGTEMLDMNPGQRDELLSTLRGCYDGSVEKSFGNGVVRIYNRLSNPPFEGFSMLTGITGAVYGHRKADLGERFLKFRLREHSQAFADAINEAVLDSIGHERDVEDKLQWAAACYLDTRKIENPRKLPVWRSDLRERLNALVQLVSAMRAQVSREKYTDEIVHRPEKECGARLMKQLGKLGKILQWMSGGTHVDDETYRIIERVAWDTCYGFHLEIIECLMIMGGTGTKMDVVDGADIPYRTLVRRFDDLTVLGILKKINRRVPSRSGGKPADVYQVGDRFSKLWNRASPGSS